LILDLGLRRLPVPNERWESWMDSHRSIRPANSSWIHQEIPTQREGLLQVRQETGLMEFYGKGGRVHVDYLRHRLNTFCDGGFWIEKLLRFYDIALRVGQGQLATHTSVIRKKNKVWLLAGRSGYGKSTASLLAEEKGWTKVQDDLAFLKDGYYQSAIDWAEPSRKKTSGALKVTGIALLEQSNEHKLMPMTYKEAIIALGPIWGYPSLQEPQQWLDILDREMREIPAFTLRFKKDAGFARLLDEF
jgi:hypothetical protein